MFAGIVELLGTVTQVESRPPGVRMSIAAGGLADGACTGESIAINGCCLTVVAQQGQQLGFDVGPETLARTNLKRLEAGSRVNLEGSLKIGDQLGGHFVTGHIDAEGSLQERTDDGEWSVCWFHAPADLMLQMASKGSIAVDGVSLTLVDVEADRFSVALIPHTLAVTTLGRLRPGDPVNLETDLLAKYVQRQLESRLGA
jgi:riboflavin synthase